MSSRSASNADYADITEVSAAYPEAVKILVVEGGWIVFATEGAFERWRRRR